MATERFCAPCVEPPMKDSPIEATLFACVANIERAAETVTDHPGPRRAFRVACKPRCGKRRGGLTAARASCQNWDVEQSPVWINRRSRHAGRNPTSRPPRTAARGNGLAQDEPQGRLQDHDWAASRGPLPPRHAPSGTRPGSPVRESLGRNRITMSKDFRPSTTCRSSRKGERPVVL